MQTSLRCSYALLLHEKRFCRFLMHIARLGLLLAHDHPVLLMILCVMITHCYQYKRLSRKQLRAQSPIDSG